MKKMIFLLACLYSIVSFGQVKSSYSDTYIPLKYIQDTTKNTLVMLTAPRCGACQTMKNTVMADSIVHAKLKNMNLIIINVDGKNGYCYKNKFKETGYKNAIPYFVILDDKGLPVNSFTGYKNSKEFLIFLNTQK